MHRVIKKALETFERESKLPTDRKKRALKWLEDFGDICVQQKSGYVSVCIISMLKDRLLAAIASWVKWKFNRRLRRRKDEGVFDYSLGISTNSCPNCMFEPLYGCGKCPLRITTEVLCKGPDSPYQTAVRIGVKTPLVNALWEAVEWAVKHEREGKENGPT